MEFRKVLALRGPNIWANSPVLEAWVDLRDLKDRPSSSIPGFNDRLMGWLPTLIEHECSEGHRGGFLVRLREGTFMAHILEHVTLELQGLAGTPVGYGRARETAEEGVYKVVVKYKEEALARACLESARALILAAIEDRPFDVEGEVRRLRALAFDVCLGMTGAIVEAARARGIPTRRLNTEGLDDSLVQLGHGVKQRRILSSYTERTGSIAETIAQDKGLTKVLLHSLGVPVPEGRAVASAEDAWDAAEDLGLPVVVKPRDADYGDGVSLALNTRDEVTAAYAVARQKSANILVERLAPGVEHRLLIVAGRLIAAARREPPSVVGDGRSTVAELIERVNQDPRRSTDHQTPLWPIRVDDAALKILQDQGFQLDSVPGAGVRVAIRRNAHLWDGGLSIDVTEQVHPEVAARAIDAAKAVGLDIAGIDLVAEDIARPLEEQGGVVVEVNAGPGIRMHLEPAAGTRQPVGEAIVASLFPDGEDGRIPIVAVTGVNGKTTTTRLVAHVLREAGKVVGMTCTDGIEFDGRPIESGDCAGPKSARMVLLNPRVEAAVFECARGGILREGLGFDRCAVAVVTNIGEGDHLGLADVHTLEKLAQVKRTIVDVVLPEGTAVLKADDPHVAAMAPHCRGSVLFFGLDGDHPVLRSQREGGGRSAFVADGQIVLAEGPRAEPLVGLDEVPLTHGGSIGFQVENALAAAAACWSLGIPKAEIVRGLRSFAGDDRQAPGRFNVIAHGDATIIADFGHNPSALKALTEALSRFPHPLRTVVFSGDGDRPDDSILRQTAILAGVFDRFFLYEEPVRRRGRAAGEILGLIQRGLADGPRTPEAIVEAGELAAIEAALRAVRPGELLVILQDAVASSMAFLRRYLATNPPTHVNGQPASGATGNGRTYFEGELTPSMTPMNRDN